MGMSVSTRLRPVFGAAALRATSRAFFAVLRAATFFATFFTTAPTAAAATAPTTAAAARFMFFFPFALIVRLVAVTAVAALAAVAATAFFAFAFTVVFAFGFDREGVFLRVVAFRDPVRVAIARYVLSCCESQLHHCKNRALHLGLSGDS